MSDQVSLCDSIEPLLGDYADGEVVSVADKARIESHLKICPRCTSEIAFLRATNFVVSSRYPDVQPPVDLFVRTALATYNRPTLRARIAGWFAPMPVRLGVGSAVAAAVVVAVVVPISRSQFGDSTTSPVATNESAKVHAGPARKARVPAAQAKTAVAEVAPAIAGAHHNPAIAAAKYAAASAVPELQEDRAKVSAEKSVVRPAFRVAKANTAVAPSRDLPAIINRVKMAPLVIPAMRERELSRRGGDFQRTLANGDLPKEFAAPKVGVPIEEAPAPARIATLTSPSFPAIGGEPSTAHSVVEPPPVPKGLHISLAGAGGRVAMAAISGMSLSRKSEGPLPGSLDLPMDEKTDTDDSAKNASHGKIP